MAKGWCFSSHEPYGYPPKQVRIGLRLELLPRRTLLCLLTLIPVRSEEHTSELQSLMRISYAVFCLKKKKIKTLKKHCARIHLSTTIIFTQIHNIKTDT